MNFAIDLGLGKTLKILIAKSIKEGAINKAKNKSILGFFLSFLLAAIQWLFFFLLKSIVMNVMLKEELVRNNFELYSEYYVYKIFLDVFLITSIYVLKAINKSNISFQLHILCFYVTALILICYFAIVKEWRISGVWIAYMISQGAMIGLIAVYLIFILDWRNEIKGICMNKIKINLNKT